MYITVMLADRDTALKSKRQPRFQGLINIGCTVQDLWSLSRSIISLSCENYMQRKPQEQTDASGGARAAKEPGHFELRTSSSQVTRMHFFPQKVDSRRPQNTKANNAAEIVSLSK